MEYINIEYKKPAYKIKTHLKEHLGKYSRLDNLPITYEDMCHFDDLIPLEDEQGNKTLWHLVLYNQNDLQSISKARF